MARSFSTLVDLLRGRADRMADRVAFTFLLEDGSEERLTYGQLDRDARGLAMRFRHRALGERALLLYPPGLDYIRAFFACLYAGLVPVPAYPPRANGHLGRLQAIVTDSDATLALTTDSILASVEARFADSPSLRSLEWMVLDRASDQLVDAWAPPAIDSQALAFLQYTSGSTALPKGVMLTHGNLLHNLGLIERSFGTSPESRCVIWLPPYHDMGLIGGILQPLFTGYPVTLMAPVDFIQRPFRWLETISRLKATVSGGPNFAYDLCLQKITPEQRDTLDLSGWEVAFTGAEPVRAETLERFADYFAPCGFRKEAFYPCYGLAEGTLFVSGGARAELPIVRQFDGASLTENRALEVADFKEGDRTLVSSGRLSQMEQQIVIVDPQTAQERGLGEVGEIWVSGPSVAQGYWNRAEQTQEVFQARIAASGEASFLRTGDLGFVQEGELYVTGRLKDLIIIRGRNYYPQDVEFTVQESHVAVKNSNGAAFSVEVEGEERLVVVQEIERTHRRANLAEVATAVRQAVSEEHQLQVYAVVLLKPVSIPKTSSGKVQRHACRNRFVEGTLDVLFSDLLDAQAEVASAASAETSLEEEALELKREHLLALDPERRQAALEAYLIGHAARVLRLAPAQVSAEQSLHALGLDSLMAVELKQELEDSFGVVLPFADFLAGPSIAELVRDACVQLDGADASEASPASSEHLSVASPISALSHGQQALWFLHRLDPDSAAYNIARAARVVDLDLRAFSSALDELVNRHPLLRANFSMQDGLPIQVVREEASAHLEWFDATAWSEEALRERLQAEAIAPFDLESGAPMRIHLFKRSEREHVLLFNAHHLIVDFWSLSVLVQELQAYYQAAKRSEALSFAAPRRAYADHVREQAERLAGKRGAELFAYWEQQLGGELPRLDLPTDHPRPPVQTSRGSSRSFALPSALAPSLKRLAKEMGVTLHMVFLAVFQVLLHRYSGQEDILVGSPTTGRTSGKDAGVIGYYVNPVVQRADFSAPLTFAEFLQQVRATVIGALEHQEYPFSLLVDRLQPKRDLSYPPLFQAMFTYQQSHLAHAGMAGFALGEPGVQLQIGDMSLTSLPLAQEFVQFDLALTIAEVEDAFAGRMEFNTALFLPETVERMIAHFETLVESVVQDCQQQVAELAMLTEVERQRLLIEWNKAGAGVEAEACVHQQFEAQVERTPDAIALVFEDSELTFGELSRRVDRLADLLQQHGVGPNALVGLCMERSLEMVVGLLAIFKAGGAYVPLDPSYPQDRLAFMIQDAKLSALLVDEERVGAELVGILPETVCLTVCGASLEMASEAVVRSAATPDDLAYVIYTSGSTGLPKGVLLTHRNVVNFFVGMDERVGCVAGDAMLAVTSISFDIAVLEIFWTLTRGGKVVLLSEEEKIRSTVSPGDHADPASDHSLQALAVRHAVTLMQCTPSLMTMIAQNGAALQALGSLRALMLGGEALPQPLAERLLEALPSTRLINMYGPTEATVWATTHEVDRQNRQIKIGRPIANYQAYVLDRHLQPVPIGVAGELYIGGAGVASGYLNRPELTEERFLAHPFAGAGRLYRTGDAVRWLADGTLDYIGRIDNQVKINGNRVELGEIEARLGQHQAVREAAVVVREVAPGEQRMVAYLVVAVSPVPEAGEWRSFLRESLPDFMVPSAFVVLEAMPLTPNGKIDRRALPAPDRSQLGASGVYVAPRTEVEQVLADVWASALKLQRVGIEDNFFELGGDSILSIQIINRANQLGIRLQPKDLFKHQTIAELSAVASVVAERIADRGLVTGVTALSPSQQQFLQQQAADVHHANRAVWLTLKEKVEVSVLREAIAHLLMHHDALRMHYLQSETGWRQVTADLTAEVPLVALNLSELEASEQEAVFLAEAERLQASFNLAEAPLVRFLLADFGAERAGRLLIVAHQLIIDSASWQILLSDLEAAYRMSLAGEAIRLPEKTASFKAWSDHLAQFAAADDLPAALEQTQGAKLYARRLPIDQFEGENTVASSRQIAVKLSVAETEALLQDALNAYHTKLEDLLLSALVKSFASWTNESSLLIELERDERDGGFAGLDLSRTVGWLTSSSPVYLFMGESWDRTIKKVKETIRSSADYSFDDYVFINWSEEGQQKERYSTGRPDVVFRHLGHRFEESPLFADATEGHSSSQSGRNKRRHLLEIDSFVVGGQLQFVWTYSAHLHEERTIETIVVAYLETLRELLAHCLSPEAGGFTPSDFPEAHLTQEQLDQVIAGLADRALPRAEIEQMYELSSVQQGMLYHSLVATQSGMYVTQVSLELRGAVDGPALKRAWESLLDRHTILRTCFYWQGTSNLLQIVSRKPQLPFAELDWQSVTPLERAERMRAFLQEDSDRGFELHEAPLMRLTLIRLQENAYRLVWTFHHLLLDGWSLPLLLQESFALYNAYAQGREAELPAVRPYRDYIAWLQKQDLTAAKSYWQQRLAGFAAPTPLGAEKTRSSSLAGETKYAEQELALSERATASLTALARQHQLTMNTLVQGAWSILLSRYSGEADVVFGTTLSGRAGDLAAVDSMVGLFINTLPVRAQIAPDAPVLSLLQEMQAQQLEMREFEQTPLLSVQEWSDLPRGVNLFDSILVFENYPIDEALSGGADGLEVTDVSSVEMTNYPLTVTALPGERLTLKASYDCQRFEDVMVAQMIGHLLTLLESVSNGLSRPIGELQMMTERERQELLTAGNELTATFPQELCIHQRVERQAMRTPDAIAISYEGQELTYRELNLRANRLAHRLQSLGVRKNQLVGICMERSAEMIVGLLGILKAGGAYLPLDPTYPQDRLAFMLEDSQIAVLVTQELHLDSLPAHRAEVVCLDRDELADESDADLQSDVTPDDLAYVIYTSGSTGKPKGVPIPHANVGRLFDATDAWYSFDQQDVWTLFHSFAFDFSVWEIWGALFYGGKLVVVPYWVSRSPEAYYDLLLQERVTVLNQTPSAFRQLISVDLSKKGRAELSLRYVIFGGEALELSSLLPWFERHGDRQPQLVNMYGITETTVHVTYRPITLEDAQRGAGSVIGIPIPDLQVYVLDQSFQPVPIGVMGEMYVGGAGVARGYLNRPELTAERFLTDRFAEREGALLYRTGDLARRLPSGELEYGGRIDSQVKIRGFRIELGEIESVLRAHPLVRECVVVAREDRPGDKRLVAYLVAIAAEDRPEVGALRDHLKGQLPDYMVPAAFVWMKAIPLTANGKTDVRALPTPDQVRAELGRDHVAPRNDVERALAEIWSNLLRVERVGVHDNFFELGGDSILSIQIINRANKQGIHLTPKDLFQHQTIAELAEVAGNATAMMADQGMVTGPVGLTPVQRWFFEQELVDAHHYNQALTLDLQEAIDPDAMREALSHLMMHHDALRMRYLRGEQGVEQVNEAWDGDVPFVCIDLSDRPASEQERSFATEAERLQAALSLTEGPLVQFAHFRMGEGIADRLLLVIHHLVVDGVSWRILLEDLETAYLQRAAGVEIKLPPKTTSFQEWSVRLDQYRYSESLVLTLDHWEEVHQADVRPLPTDFSAGENDVASSREVTISLSVEETLALLQEAPKAYHTQINDLLLTALVQSFADWTGERSLLVALEGHGRETYFGGGDVSRTVGWFTSLYPVALQISAADVGRKIQEIKEQLRTVPGRGLEYGVLRYLDSFGATLGESEGLAHPQVLFNYLGQFDQSFAGSSLFALSQASSGSMQSGRNARNYLLEINGGVQEGQLRLTWTYSANQYREETIERVASSFLNSLRELIEHCQTPEAGGFTPSDFPQANLNQAELDGVIASLADRSLSSRDLEQLYALSHVQQGMLYHSLISPDSGVYVTQVKLDLHGQLDREALERAWQQVVGRHAILRTSFYWQGDRDMLQVVKRDVKIAITTLDWQQLSAEEQAERFVQFLQADSKRGFDLQEAPLMRLVLIKLEENVHRLVWTMHHLLLDGWSLPLLFKEVFALYDQQVSGTVAQLGYSRPYREYIAWLQFQSLSIAEQHWRKKLAGFDTPTSLGVERARGSLPAEEEKYAEQKTALSADATASLQALARQHQLTLSTLVQGAWAILLARYSGGDDVVFGTTVSGRPAQLAGVETMVGLFINTLPMRATFTADTPLLTFLQELQAQQVEVREFEYTPLVSVQEWSDIPRGTNLFDSILVFENYPIDEALSGEVAGLAVSDVSAVEMTNYPLTVVALPGQELTLKVSYDRQLYEDGTIDKLLGHLRTMIEQMLTVKDQTVADLPMLTAPEKQQLLVEWNDASTPYPEVCIDRLFSEQAERTPDAVAVVYQGEQLTYRELNARANQLAHHLQKRGVGAETFVGITTERSLGMIVSLLAILKAGGTYVPIDPNYPAERIAYILEDTGLQVLVTTAEQAEKLPAHQAQLICTDREAALIAAESEETPLCATDLDRLAYVIYTSGSTGKPKGVCVPHRGVVRLVKATNYVNFSPDEVFLQFAPVAFDASTFEIWGSLLNGARLVIFPTQLPSLIELGRVLREHQVTTIFLTTALFHQMVEARLEDLQSVRQLLAGGEVMSAAHLKKLIDQLPNTQFIHVYGPTETTTFASFHPVREVVVGQSVPIGKPISNTSFYVLDRQLQPVPVGVAGELYIGGAGLARGYLNQPELTRTAFVPSPFAEGERLYKTGDLVRYLPDGSIDFLARIDSQVKIRGFRIELGEIESVLSGHESVQEVVVIAREDVPGDRRLVAYLVAQEAVELEGRELRSYLKERLPDYMIPSAFVLLEKLPLNQNGKVDRRALPAPDLSQLGAGNDYEAPRNEVEQSLADIWSTLLRVKQVGIHDNFFELGGDSILSIQIINRANQQGIHLTPKDLFHHQTIAELAAVAGTATETVIDQGMVTGAVLLTPIQRWFFQSQLQDAHHFNMSLRFDLQQAVDVEHLREAIAHLLLHHDALRMCYLESESGWQQENAAWSEQVPFASLDLSALAAADQEATLLAEAERLQASFALTEAPLVRFLHADLGAERANQLLVIVHHLVIDGVSWRILLQDLETAYLQRLAGRPIQLPPKTTSFQEWAKRLAEHATSESLRAEQGAWLPAKQASIERLPIDRQAGDNTVASSRHVVVKLSAAETQALLQEAPRAYNTQINDLLLTALGESFAAWTGERSLWVSLEGHGREDILAGVDLSRTVGWFTTSYPVQLQLGDHRSIGRTIKGIKEQLRALPNRGIGYGLLRYLRAEEQGQGGASEWANPQVVFNYLGQFDQSFAESSLLKLSAESSGSVYSGRNERSHLLEVNGGVQDGQLWIDWTYSAHLHREETIERLAQTYLDALRAVIEHCRSAEAGGFTPSDFPEAKLDQEELDLLVATLAERSIKRAEIDQIYALSPTQEGMLYHSLVSPDTGVYVTQVNLELRGRLDLAAMHRAWQNVLDRHAILRTSFYWQGTSQLAQVVQRHVQLPIEQLDWQELTAEEQAANIESFASEDCRRGFELHLAPLMRLTIIRLGEQVQRLIWTSHHLLLDGWSLPLLIKELFALYDSDVQGNELRLGSARPYREYIAWLQKQDLALAKAHWQQQLSGFLAPTPLGVDRTRLGDAPAEKEYREQQTVLSQELTAAMQGRARQHQLTLNNLVQGAFAIMLSRYSGEGDVLFGTTVSGRPADLTGVESMVGLFINTLPMRAQFTPETDLLTLLKGMQAQQASMREFEHTPLVNVQEWSDVPRGSDLFESILVFENYPLQEAVSKVGELEITDVRLGQMTNYPLTVTALPGESLTLHVSYDAQRFEDVVVTHMLGHLTTLLENMLSRPAQAIDDLPMLTEQERQHLLVELEADLPESDAIIHRLFEAQVVRTPDAVAVQFAGQSLTYRELNGRANRLAHHLRELGVGPDVMVTLFVERSADLVIGLLGILKAGGAYVPLDTAYPEERISLILEDSEAAIMVTQSHLLDRLPVSPASVVRLDADQERLASYSESNLTHEVAPRDLAYMIYTSGSTGRPKAVMVEHRNLVSTIMAAQDQFAFAEADVFPWIASVAFDIALFELLNPLLVGGRSEVLTKEQVLDVGRLLTDLERYTMIHTVPSLMRQIVQTIEEQQRPSERYDRLRTIFIGGDAVPPDLLQAMHRVFRQAEVQVLYGPTEGTIICSSYHVPRERALDKMVIGTKLANANLRVCDASGQAVPVGVSGELYIGGAGVSRGYFRRADLTEEKYVTREGKRWYRTGDLVRRLPDGTLEFLGRIDNQVKIRGFRIELGEIETVLCQRVDVREAIAVVHEPTPGDKRLVAYVVPEEGAELSATSLRVDLKASLPDYMVPSAFVVLEALPLNQNGKVDRRALPEPTLDRTDLDSSYVAPRNEVEQALAEIWSALLRQERVGIHDNFFELGGDSILSIQIINRANQKGVRLTPKDLFQHQTIAELAAVAGTAAEEVIDQGLVTGEVLLTPMQQWFFEQKLEAAHHFNMSVLLELKERVNLDLLREACGHLLMHHDALRMRYLQTEDGWQQIAGEPGQDVPFTALDLSALPPEEQEAAFLLEAERAQASLDLEQGSLVRFLHADLGAERTSRLLVIIHHLVTDGVSWRILLQDLELAYRQRCADEAIQLPPKTTSLQKWSERLHAYAASDALLAERDAWSQVQRANVVRLPLDHAEGVNRVESTDHLTVSLSAEETQALLQETAKAYNTQINDLLLTALAESFARWTGDRSLLVALEGHGREDLFAGVDLSRTVGWFTTSYPVLLDLSDRSTSGQAIKAVKEQLRAIPNRGIGYGLLRSELRIAAPEVLFNYLGQLDQTFAESSLFALSTAPAGAVQSGRNARSHLLEINGGVQGGQLQMTWTYSGSLHRRETIERVANSFVQALRELIAHCQSPDAGGFTPSDFPEAKLMQSELDSVVASLAERSVNRAEIEQIYALSPMQQGMLYHSLLAPDSGVYVTQLHFALHERLNLSALQRAWQTVLERHSILRTSFYWEGMGKLLQVVRRNVQVPIEQADWTHLSAEERATQLATFLEADSRRGFDLQAAPLIRMTLIEMEEGVQRLVWTSHHLLLDGWSLPLLFKELFALYDQYALGQVAELGATRPYRDYIAWLQKQDAAAAERYWRNRLAGFSVPTSIGTEKAHSSQSEAGKKYGEQKASLSEQRTESLQALARQHQLTLNTLVQGAWSILLSRYSGEEDVLFGTTVSGRPAELAGVETMVGLFINTLPMRATFSSDTEVLTFLKGLQAQQAELREYEYTPLVSVQELSEIPRGTNLFDSILVFENFPVDEAISGKAGGLKITDVVQSDMTNFPITVTALPGKALSLIANYDRQQFADETVTRLLGHLQMLIEQMLVAIERKIGDLEMMSEQEHHQQLVVWNNTATSYPEACIHQLFSEQAARTPDAVAVVFEGQQLTYAELNARANQLAHHLQQQGVGAETFVGITTERSLSLIVGLLAILKAGGVYVPINQNDPVERVLYQLEDANIHTLLTNQEFAEQLPSHPAQVVLFDRDAEEIGAQSETEPACALTPDHLAYTVYTSGSTGQPKGVCVPHRGVVRLVKETDYVSFSPDEVFLQFAPVAFDASTFEIWGSLLNGARLVLCPAGQLSLSELRDVICEHQVSTLWLTAGLFHQMVDEHLDDLGGVRQLLAGGDALSVAHVKKVVERWPNCRLINGYGPTENTTFTTCYQVTAASELDGSVPIGRPIANTTVYVLDRHLQPVPVGVAGELYIGGAGLAREYLNQPELTAQTFVTSPFAEEERLYKTGDLVRYLSDGTIDFLGRIDGQVKIRGFRIELGEVEAMIGQHPAVQKCYAMVRQDAPGDKRLVAYLVVQEQVEQSELRAFLKGRLPDYMIPSAFVQLEKLPLNQNGKVDRRALPAPDHGMLSSTHYVAPSTPTEERLVKIFADVLGVDRVGTQDNFFELGGHSLLATQIISRIRLEFQMEVPLRKLIELPTIADFAKLIDQHLATSESQKQQAPIQGLNRTAYRRKR